MEEVGGAGIRSRQVQETGEMCVEGERRGMGRIGEEERGGVVESGSAEGEGKWRGVVRKSGQEEWGCRVEREVRRGGGKGEGVGVGSRRGQMDRAGGVGRVRRQAGQRASTRACKTKRSKREVGEGELGVGVGKGKGRGNGEED